MQILRSIRERFAPRQRDAESRYAGFVSDSAAGRDSDPATLTSVLVATGRTMEQFIADVEWIERRAAAKMKLAEVERLRPACEAAYEATCEALNAVDAAHKKAEKLINDAMDNLCERGDASGSLQRQIRELEQTAREDLHATADLALQAEIDQLEARVRGLRQRGNRIGRSPHCDHDEAMKTHRELNAEEARLQDRIEELRVQQLA